MSEHPAPHGSEPPKDDPTSRTIARAQFVVTAVLLGGIAVLTYNAGLHAGRGGGEGGAPAAATSAGGGGTMDVQSLLQATPELVDKGKQLFSVNCASCHGTDGKGDGPAAAALNPKPRDFTSGYWKYGGGVARIVRTITEGSPGTAMAAFPSIPPEDRFAIAHYEQSFHAPIEADKPEDVAWAEQQFGGGASAGGATAAAGGAAAAPPVETGPTITIEQALAALAVTPPPEGQAIADPALRTGEGASLYAERCASCHGATGEGGVRTRILGSAPYVYLTTKSLGDAPTTDWPTDAARFTDLVLRGLSGYVMPANGDLTTDQVRALYDHTLMLRARQEAAARTRS
ncbi:MAG: c-type cytochrome [Hyphomicrobiales bacterium]